MKMKIFALILSFLPSQIFAASDIPEFVSVPAAGDGFEMGKYPITNALYKAFLDENPSVPPPRHWSDRICPKGKENHPVVFVSYYDALKYCAWLGTKDPSRIFGLPSVREWELSASGKGWNYPWGDKSDASRFNYNLHAASYFVKRNPIVTYIHPKSALYGRKFRLETLFPSLPKAVFPGGLITRIEPVSFIRICSKS